MDQFSDGNIFVGEIIGTAMLILLGAGVCAAVNLRFSKAKADDTHWIVVAFGWGFGMMAGACTVGTLSGGHLNPAVTLGIAINEGDNWEEVPLYLAGQMVGALIGATLCWAAYYAQFDANRDTDDASPTLGVFATAPELRNPVANVITETVATLALVLPLLAFGLTEGIGESGLGSLLVAFLVVGIGLSLGGPTGYAINPARDLGPRVAQALLPIPNRGSSVRGHAWVPVVGPLAGGAPGALIFKAVF